MNAGFDLGRTAELVNREIAFSGNVPVRERLRLWRRGFISPSGVIYGTDQALGGDYLPDYARYVRTARINGRFARMLDNKLAFDLLMNDVAAGMAPRLLGTVFRGELRLQGDPTGSDTSGALDALLDRHGAFVVKPVEGTLGIGVLFIAREPEGTISLNGEVVSRARVLERLERCKADIVTERLRQAAYAQSIHPWTTNTIRMLSLRFPDSEVIIPAATHRFGAKGSGPIDAWHQGGLAAPVDLETGTLGVAAGPPGSTIEWFRRHPDTDEPIEGVTIPGWSDLLATITEIARRLPFLPYLGWDLLVTDDGPRVIEANNRSELDLLQIHTPLLRDPRVRRFFELHDVIPRSTAGA